MLDRSDSPTDARATDTANESILLREDKDTVAVLTLNRPKARNSLSEELLTALQKQIDNIAETENIRVVIIAANGPAFCAGHDLRQLTEHRSEADGGRDYYKKIMRQCSKLMQSIVHLPKPVIAAVHATATAAGCQLVASCDLAVASEEAKFATPGVNIGLFCSTPMVALSRNVSRKQALEMLLLGEMIPANEAREFGLINRVVPVEEVMDEAMHMAEKISAKSSLTVAIGKEAFYRQIEESLEDAYDYASDVMTQNMMARDAEEGIGAFLEKRKPEWENR